MRCAEEDSNLHTGTAVTKFHDGRDNLFQAAQTFLERVLTGICDPLGVSIGALLTDGGRQRLVLGSGGVARDYLHLTQNAPRNANERAASPWRPHNRITAEDVNEAAAGLSATKQQDLARDAGPNAENVRQRLTDVARFCLDVNGTNVFLVEGTHLQEDEWGKEIQALADLRLVHQIGNLSVQTGSYRGRRFAGFTLDLSNWTGTRSERIEQIEFWTPTGRQDARRARLIYTEGASDRPAPVVKHAEPEPNNGEEELTGDRVQTDIFSLLNPPTQQSDLKPVETVEPILEVDEPPGGSVAASQTESVTSSGLVAGGAGNLAAQIADVISRSRRPRAMPHRFRRVVFCAPGVRLRLPCDAAACSSLSHVVRTDTGGRPCKSVSRCARLGSPNQGDELHG